MDLGLHSKIALVAGSTSGLGRATAERLSEEGARVVIVGRRGDLARDIATSLPDSWSIQADVTKADDRRRLIDEVREECGGVDVLILNGGGPKPGIAQDLDTGAAEEAFASLVAPHIDLVNGFLPRMREQGWGRIVAIGSSGVQQPIPNLTASNLGRAGLAGYLKTLAGEVASDGVTVNMVLPGRIGTDRVGQLDRANAERAGLTEEVVRERSIATIPAGRYGDVEEFAATVAFAASGPASYITGEQIRCDGGMIRHH